MADAMFSSPDPLNDSLTFQAPPKTRRSSRARSSLPSQGSSPKKQTFELDVGDQISPQKIRVTVEAGESDIENTYAHYIESRENSPSKSRAPKNRRRQRTTTTTTTVPVKGLSDSEDEVQHIATPKKARGRPRKSLGTPPAKKRGRGATPTRKPNTRRKSINGSEVEENGEDPSFQIGAGVEIGRGKGGSRSRSRKTTARKSTPASKPASSDRGASSTASKKGRGRRKTLLPEDVAVLEDIRNDDSLDKEAGEAAEMSGALQPTDANEAYTASPYSTIRSTTTIEDAQPDIVIARFNPGNETPRRTGWSSPRIVEAPRPSSPLQQYSSHEEFQLAQQDDESVAMVPVPPSNMDEDEEQQYDDEEEERDNVGDMREFDTIIESEGFSMISVDSVPSLREHLSSPPNQNEEAESARIMKNKNLLSVQEAGYDDSFSEIPEEVLEAATPGRKAPNSQLLSVQNSRLDDTFSSMPPEILKAATPAGKSQVLKSVSNKNSRVEDSFPSIAPEALESATPPNATLSAQKLQNQQAYDDSFSAIPEEILEAATPAPKPHAVLKSTGSQPIPKSDALKVPGLKLDMSHPTRSLSPRLLTPEETPSPPAESSKVEVSRSNAEAASRSSERNAGEKSVNSSLIHSHMPSSPPSVAPRRYTYTAHLRNHRQLHPDVAETPSIVFSSPSLPPPIHQQREQINQSQGSQQAQRPPLSPIARAGRVLQDIAVPSSPRSRSQSLGSPFKSPISDRKSSSVAREVQPTTSSSSSQHTGSLAHLGPNGNFAALSSERTNRSRPVAQEDPFSHNSYATSQHSSSSDERQRYSLELPSHKQQGASDSRLSTIRSEANSVRSDDAMSWQAEEEIPLSGSAFSASNIANPSENTRRSSSETNTRQSNFTWDQQDAARRAAVSKEIESASASKVIVIESDEENTNTGRKDDDEDFDLLIETMSSSPVGYERQDAPKETLEKPRRSKIPSPWRKNSKRLVYSDELSQLSSPRMRSSIGPSKGFSNITTSKPVTVRHMETAHPLSDDTEDADLSGWQIPQKSNFQPRPKESGDLDLSALLSASPPKKLPTLSTSSRNVSSRLETSSDQSQSRQTSKQPSPDLISNSSRDKKPFAPIAEKQGFTPRPRSQASSPVKQPTFGLFGTLSNGPISTSRPQSSSSAAQPLAPSSPNRGNIQPRHQTPSQPSPPEHFNDSTSSLTSNADKENHAQTTINRTLKWTETVRLTSISTSTSVTEPSLTSPTKSCLRSPLKPSSADYGFGSSQSPSKAVTFVSSSPMPSSPPQPLSSTTWSREHWLVLDRIVQSWKPENQELLGANKRRNSTRVISRLLGRKVHDAQGDSMVMEQWHLEAVDEFRGVVAGWEEKAVAMRVFALLIGEVKRRERGEKVGSLRGSVRGGEKLFG